nr:unnamed protein product [Callosobruchus analis]
MERRRYGSRRQRKKQLTWLKKFKEYVRQLVAFLFSNVGIIGLVVGYTIAGSFIFMTIEGRHVQKMKLEVIGNRTLYAQKLWNITMQLNAKVMSKEEFHRKIADELFQYQKIVVNFTRRGYDGTDELNCTAQWSFAGAFLYSLTVITTIGEYSKHIRGNVFS